MPRIRPITAAAALLGLLASACGSGSLMGYQSVDALAGLPTMSLEPSREFVLASAARTESSTYRFEASISMLMDMGFVALEIDGDTPMMTGTYDGNRSSMRVDVGVMFDEMAASGPMFEDAAADLDAYRDQLIVEMVQDGSTMYLHAPLFSVPGMDATGSGLDLGALATGWGRVDLTQVAELGIGDLTSLGGAGSADPMAIIDLLEHIGADIRTDGSERVHGVDTTRLLAPVTFGDLLRAQGDPGALLGGLDAGLDALAGATIDIAVNIDAHGLVRRIAYDIDFGEAFGPLMADETGGMFDDLQMRMGMTIDFVDYGHTELVSVPLDARDLTDLFSGFSGWAA